LPSCTCTDDTALGEILILSCAARCGCCATGNHSSQACFHCLFTKIWQWRTSSHHSSGARGVHTAQRCHSCCCCSEVVAVRTVWQWFRIGTEISPSAAATAMFVTTCSCGHVVDGGIDNHGDNNDDDDDDGSSDRQGDLVLKERAAPCFTHFRRQQHPFSNGGLSIGRSFSMRMMTQWLQSFLLRLGLFSHAQDSSFELRHTGSKEAP
jgi:hypothetical protein